MQCHANAFVDTDQMNDIDLVELNSLNNEQTLYIKTETVTKTNPGY